MANLSRIFEDITKENLCLRMFHMHSKIRNLIRISERIDRYIPVG